MSSDTMACLSLIAIAILLVKLVVFLSTRHDNQILSLMKKGEGPYVYTTYSGETHINTQKLIKKKFQTQGS